MCHVRVHSRHSGTHIDLHTPSRHMSAPPANTAQSPPLHSLGAPHASCNAPRHSCRPSVFHDSIRGVLARAACRRGRKGCGQTGQAGGPALPDHGSRARAPVAPVARGALVGRPRRGHRKQGASQPNRPAAPQCVRHVHTCAPPVQSASKAPGARSTSPLTWPLDCARLPQLWATVGGVFGTPPTFTMLSSSTKKAYAKCLSGFDQVGAVICSRGARRHPSCSQAGWCRVVPCDCCCPMLLLLAVGDHCCQEW
jgi:hypothetical protein